MKYSEFRKRLADVVRAEEAINPRKERRSELADQIASAHPDYNFDFDIELDSGERLSFFEATQSEWDVNVPINSESEPETVRMLFELVCDGLGVEPNYGVD